MKCAWAISWIVTVAVGLLTAPSVAGEALEAGVAVVDITPLPGYRMCGYFYERLNTGTHDPLLAKAVVFKQGDTLAALVFCDLAQLDPHVARDARNIVERLSAIPAGNISIAATHSHTGPLYFGALRKHFHDRTVAKHGRDVHELVDYPAELTGRLVRAILAARQNLRPVTLSAGFAHEDRLSFNRRFHMKSGPVVFNPGHLHPDIVRPAAPIDPQVGLIALAPRGAARPSAAIVSFALHLDTVGGTLYAADFPFHLQNELRKAYGDAFVSLFGAGTCGDINHVDVTKKIAEGRRTAGQIGSLLAQTVEQQIPKLARVDAPSLAVKHAVVEVPAQSYSPAEIAGAELLMQRIDDDQVPFLDRVAAYKIMDLQLRGGRTLALEVHAFRFSDKLAIVTLPGEVFVELGLAIKQGSPFETTLVIELANDGPGYIPTSKAFAEGSYETVNSRVASGGGEQMVELAVRLLNELAGKSATTSP